MEQKRGRICTSVLTLSILASKAYSLEWCPNSRERYKISHTGVVCHRTDNKESAEITCKVLVFIYAAMAIVLTIFLIVFLRMRKKQEESSFIKRYEGLKNSQNSVVEKINKIMNHVSDNPFLNSVNKTNSVSTENTDWNDEYRATAKESKMSTIMIDDE